MPHSNVLNDHSTHALHLDPDFVCVVVVVIKIKKNGKKDEFICASKPSVAKLKIKLTLCNFWMQFFKLFMELFPFMIDADISMGSLAFDT